MGDATVTINDLAATTKTSGHEAQTVGPTDVNFNPPKKVAVPHDNQAETANAVEHTTAKTKFQNGQVVRVSEKITPSKPAHPDTGGGVVSGTYDKEAKVTRGAPDVRAEGKKPGRETDPTTQNHENTTGKVVLPAPAQVVPADPNEALKVCKYKESKIDCGHWEPTDKTEISVLRADTITVKAKRINAKDPTKGPACLKPPHMTWKVVRTGGLDQNGTVLPNKEETFTGDTLKLATVWTGGDAAFSVAAVQAGGGASSQQSIIAPDAAKGGSETRLERTNALKPDGSPNPDAGKWKAVESTHNGGMSPSDKAALLDLSNRRAQSQAIMNGRDPKAPSQADVVQGRKEAAAEARHQLATRRPIGVPVNQVMSAANLGVNLVRFMREFNAHKNPVQLQISGTGCHPDGVNYKIKCFPRSKFSHEVDLGSLKRLGQLIMQGLELIKKLGKLADVNVSNTFKFPGDDLAIGASFEWKEEENEYTVFREAKVGIKGTMCEWIFELGIPLANLLALIPVIGVGAAKLVNRALAWVGAEVAAGVGAKLSIGWAVETAFKWTEKSNQWKFDNTQIRVPFDTGIYVFARCTWPGAVNIELKGMIDGDPALIAEFKKEGLDLGLDDFTVGLVISGTFFIDTWIFSANESGSWRPESLQMKVPKATFNSLPWGK